ncbi:MAG: DMT family transporter [Bradyrhizobium sp.]|nr:DMT family transporter [Bradyrhizobium sp.]
MKRIWWPTCLETLSRRIIAAWEKGVGRFRATWAPVRVKKTRQIRSLERPLIPCSAALEAPGDCGLPLLANPRGRRILQAIFGRRFPVQTILLYLAALGAGISVAVQQVLNGSLRVSLQSPAWAGFASYLGGLLTMIVVLLALREQMPSWKLITATPWWAWSGGILGGVFILLVILLLPSLGAATLLALVVAGQMSAAVLMDHFGAFGLTQHSVSVSRLLGVALIIGGVVLMKD